MKNFRVLSFLFIAVLPAACGDATGTGADDILIEPGSLHDGWKDVAYAVQLTASGGGGGQYGWSLGSGALPDGIALDGDGRLQGTPTAQGTWDFRIDVSDASGAAGSRSLSLRICAAPLDLAVGEAVFLPASQAGDCEWFIPSGAGGDEYWVVAVRGGDTLRSAAEADLVIRRQDLASAPDAMRWVAADASARRVAASTAGSMPWGEQEMAAHAAMLDEWAKDLTGGTFHPRPLRLASAAPRAQLPATKSFNLAPNCDGPTLWREATLLGEGTYLAFYQESDLYASDPADVASVQSILDFYDAFGQTVIDDYFGGLTDYDENGRVLVLIVPSELTGAGWMRPKDLMDPAECSNSNNMELVYLTVGVVNLILEGNYYAYGMMVHEVKHVSSLARMVAGQRERHESWVEEGSACMAGEIAARLAWETRGGPAMSATLGRSDIEVVGRDNYHPAYRVYGTGRYLGGGATDLLRNGYWGGWLFHRWLADELGAAAFLEAQNLGTESGMTALPGLAGAASFEDLMARYAAAVMRNLAGFDSALDTYDFASMFSGDPIVWPDNFGDPIPAGFPWPAVTASFVSATYGGSMEPGGMRWHVLQSDGTGQGISGRTEMPADGRVVVLRTH